MSLYTQALGMYTSTYDAFYTEERYDRLYNNVDTTSLLQVQELLRDLNEQLSVATGAK